MNMKLRHKCQYCGVETISPEHLRPSYCYYCGDKKFVTKPFPEVDYYGDSNQASEGSEDDEESNLNIRFLTEDDD